MNAQKNVEVPMMYAGFSRKERAEKAQELLEIVEMGDRGKHLPEELSGGQKQRVAIARSMACSPAILLADEPTGALDSNTGRLVMDLFHKLHKERHMTIVLITHSPELAQETEKELFGYMGDEIVKLNPSDIHYISVIGGKVYAVCEKERYLLKERLYALEEKNLENFVKINQSCLANIRKTERFDTSVSGTLKIRFKNGDTDYVSRRQLKAVKERLGI
jgi:ABC-type nitrate/sulfonate/bicarbonate transport system ATPase subunit